MMAKTHNTGGFLAGLTFYHTILVNTMLSPLEAGIFFVACVVSSIFADIDHPEARLGRKVRFLSTWIYKCVGHRTLTHSLVSLGFVAMIPFVSAILGQTYVFWGGLGFLIGHASHIMLDMLTNSGVALLYPYKRRFSILPFKTGGLGEYVVLFIMIGLILWQLNDVVMGYFEAFGEALSELFILENLIN